jgi:hypothetical protein
MKAALVNDARGLQADVLKSQRSVEALQVK